MGEPPKAAQEQAEAQSGRKATRPKTRKTTERRPVSSRVDTMIDKYALFTLVRGSGILGSPRIPSPVPLPHLHRSGAMGFTLETAQCEGEYHGDKWM